MDYIRKSPHRNQIEKYLYKFLPQLDGRVLEVGSKNRRYDSLFKNAPIAIDITPNETKGVIFGDINNLSFDSESFDAVVCLEVLEYVKTPEKAISEMSRVIKKEGTLILSVPFMYRVHDDMLRYTKKYLNQSLSEDFSSVECFSIGNAYTIILDIIKDKINKIHFTPLRYVCLLPYILFALLIETGGPSKNGNFVSGYFVVAKKK